MSTRSSKNIIIVEPDNAERAHGVALLTRNGWSVRDTDSSYEAIQWLKGNEADMLIIDRDATPLNASQTVDYIRRELGREVHVFISTCSNEVQENDNDAIYFIKPLNDMHLDAISRIGNSTVEPEPAYSLHYLTSLSESNQEFILDCLNVFKVSVTLKMSQLFKALEEKDYKTIGEIAHNIKPSFEMLENNLSTEICNKLSYSATSTEIPELVAALNKEFNRIINKLETDLPELKHLWKKEF